jgi:hypothetical protein
MKPTVERTIKPLKIVLALTLAINFSHHKLPFESLYR